jgi:hypothetical protein
MQVFETSDDILEKINWKYFWKEYRKRVPGKKLTAKERRTVQQLFANTLPLPSKAVQALQKALEMGNQPPSSLAKGSALQVESLDATLNCVTFDEKHLKFPFKTWGKKNEPRNRKNKNRKRTNRRRKKGLRRNPKETGFARQIKLNKRPRRKSKILSGRWFQQIFKRFTGRKGKKKG